MYSDGSVDPVRACLNSPHFRSFTKEHAFADRCIALFRERYEKPMLGGSYGINLDSIEAICNLDSLGNIGSDPYWSDIKDRHPYDFVYEATKRNLEVCQKFKDHNIWIQGYQTQKGREEEIIWATDAAYDSID